MKDLTEYIDTLILEYDCVIIPDFGGFVLNKESARIGDIIMPPSVIIGFNPVLKHNDGLLAEKYMKSKSISYDAACKQIKEAVKKINGFLSAKQTVIFPNIGSFSINDDSNLVFTPTKGQFHHPLTFGLSPIGLKRLEDISVINKDTERRYKQLGIKRSLGSIAATAAAVILFFMVSTPIENTDNTQKGSFIANFNTKADLNIKSDHSSFSSLDITQEDFHNNALSSNVSKTVASTKEKETISNNKPTDTATSTVKDITQKKTSLGYYIIVGSSPSEVLANKMVANLKNDGFNEAKIVPSNGKMRVAIVRFEDKSAGEKYLNNFRIKYPEYSDAWLLSSRQ